MGVQNVKNKKDEEFRISLRLIGENMGNFLKTLSGSNKSNFSKDKKEKTELEHFWDYHYEENLDFETQLNHVYDMINVMKKNNIQKGEFKECLIIRIKNIKSPEVEKVLEKQNKVGSKDFRPLILFLSNEFDSNIKLVIPSKYKKVEPRGIFLCKFQENKGEEEDNNFENILYILYRFCSYHNDLGDIIELGDGDKNVKIYDLVQRHYPFNLNICCVGKFGEGKSTGVNFILGELKAKESNLGAAQTRNLNYYYHSSMPIRVLDIPGFEDEVTVNNCIEKIKKSTEEAIKYKEKLHIILYFMTFTSTRTFTELEKQVLLELNNHEDTQLIYVITHYEKDEDDEEEDQNKRNEFIQKINNGLVQKLGKISNFNEIFQKLEASEKNVVFVNFYEEKHKPQIGIDQLFLKIREFFKKTSEYQNFKKMMFQVSQMVSDGSEENKKKEFENTVNSIKDSYFKDIAKILRKRAESEVRKYKVSGSFLGCIPIVNFYSHNWISKKATKVLGEIYGIEIKFSEKDQKKENNKKHLYFVSNNAKYECKKYDPLIGIEIDSKMLNSYIAQKCFKKAKSFSIYGLEVSFLSYVGGIISSSLEESIPTASSVLSFTSSFFFSFAVIGSAVVNIGFSTYMTNKHINELIDSLENMFLNQKKMDIFFCYYLINIYLDVRAQCFNKKKDNKLMKANV